MWKVIAPFVLAAISLNAFAATTTAPATTVPTATATTHNAHRLPVIVRNEVIAPNKCRLHFEGGSSLEVKCSSTQQNQQG